jgi:hypothetical protein
VWRHLGVPALHARQVPHTVPPISVEVTTTTTTPTERAPPITVAVPPSPTTAAPQPVVDCLTLLNQANVAWQQNLGRFPSKQELAEVVQEMGRADCEAAVDSYQPGSQYNPGRPPTGCDISPTDLVDRWARQLGSRKSAER